MTSQSTLLNMKFLCGVGSQGRLIQNKQHYLTVASIIQQHTILTFQHPKNNWQTQSVLMDALALQREHMKRLHKAHTATCKQH